MQSYFFKMKLISKFFLVGLTIVLITNCSKTLEVSEMDIKKGISYHAQLQNGHRVMKTAHNEMVKLHNHLITEHLELSGEEDSLLISIRAAHKEIIERHKSIIETHQKRITAHESILKLYESGNMEKNIMLKKLKEMENEHEEFLKIHSKPYTKNKKEVL